MRVAWGSCHGRWRRCRAAAQGLARRESAAKSQTARLEALLPRLDTLRGIVEAAGLLGNSVEHARQAAEAIMTSDTRPKEVAVEFTSMSKTYSMAGWRMGFAVGNEELVAALGRVKSYLDYGAFTPIQAAATAALNGPQDIIEANRRLYKARRDCLVRSFARAGWDIPVPEASMFAWAPIPEQFAKLGSMEFAKKLRPLIRTQENKLVLAAPWGPHP